MSQFVELDLIRVLLRRIRPRVTHQRLQGDQVATTLAQEAIGEAVPQLMRGEPSDACALADAPDHPHQRLVARPPLRILPAPLAIVRGDPLLDLDREHVIVQLGLQLAEALAQLIDDVGIERQPVPVLAFPMHPDAAANEVEVGPPAADDLRTPQAGPLHEHQRRPLVRQSHRPQLRKLVQTRPVHVGLPLWRSADLPRRVELDQILGFRSGED